MTTSVERSERPAVSASSSSSPTAALRSAVIWTLALALLAGIAMLAFVASPVVEHTARYSWSAAQNGSSAALPLDPYYPAELTVEVPCAALSGTSAQPVLSTYPLTDSAGAGLQIGSGRSLAVNSEGATLASGAQPPSGCNKLVLHFDSTSTTITADGTVLETEPGDHRPRVTGFFSSAPASSGLSASVVPDTQFDSSPSWLKILLAVVAVVALVLALLGVRRIDQLTGGSHGSGLRARWCRLPRLRIADVLVIVLLPVWAVIGPPTPDDGYITEIINGRSDSGLLSNYAHWYNTPEAPFGWFYEFLAAWAHISHSNIWMRVPSVVIGILTWLFLSRMLAPRLLPALHRAKHTLPARIALVATFLLWWLPFGQGLRSETWLMIGTGATVYLVDRACSERRFLPLCLALLVAGLTVGLAPTGVVAFMPFLAALPRLVHWLRKRPKLVLLAVATAGAAALGAVVLLMFSDQSLAAVLSGTKLRTEVGPNSSWQEEYLRYQRLFGSPSIEGTVARLAPILLSAAAGIALAGVLLRDRKIHGIRLPMLKLVLISYLLSFVALAATPTKLTHHFAAVGVLGALLVSCVAYAAGPPGAWGAALRTPMRRGLLYVGGGLTLAVVFRGYNGAWLLSSLGLPFELAAPTLFGIQVSTLCAVLGVLAGAVSILAGLLAQSPRGAETYAARSEYMRAQPHAHRPAQRMATTIALALSLCLVFEVTSFAYALVSRIGTYTLGGANVSSLGGHSCGLADDLVVEDDPAAGVVGAGSPALAAFDTTTTGTALPTWRAAADAPSALTSGWLSLPDSARKGELPLVVATHGITAANTAAVELRSAPSAQPTTMRLDPATADVLPSTDLVDVRLDVSKLAPSATEFRVLASSTDLASPVGPLAVAAPRVPVGRSLTEFTAGDLVATDWVNAFFYPCLTQPNTIRGRVEVAKFQVTTISRASGFGLYDPVGTGPLAGIDAVTTRQEIPVYLSGDPRRQVAHLFRFISKFTTVLDHPELQDLTRSGIAKTTQQLRPTS